MSTFISLVVVGVCVVVTTWLVLRDGGKPATETPPDHREPRAPEVRTAAGTERAVEHQTEDQTEHEVEDQTEAEPSVAPIRAVATQAVSSQAPASGVPSDRATPAQAPPQRRVRRRRVRTAAPQRVRARRRDHPHLGQDDASERLLVAPSELPDPQPEAVRPAQRLRSGVGLLALVVCIGLGAAVVLGLAVVAISDLLEDAVR